MNRAGRVAQQLTAMVPLGAPSRQRLFRFVVGGFGSVRAPSASLASRRDLSRAVLSSMACAPALISAFVSASR